MNGFGRRVPACRSRRLMLLAQLGATLVVLGWLPGNPAKLVVMVSIWLIGFNRIAGAELVMIGAVNLLFVLMNLAVLRRGIFAFEHPDLFGMPIYEYLMWGFYVLHTIRFLDGAPPPRSRIFVAVAAASGFAVTFATIAAPTLLLLASGSVLTVGLVVFHEKMDFAYTGYMAVLGALVEHVGVSTGQWHYPGHPWGAVPLWSLTMWAGVGLFSRRLAVPLMLAGRRGPAAGF